MNFKQLITADEQQRNGGVRRAGHWWTVDDGRNRKLYHYNTLMCHWNIDDPQRTMVVDSVGHGSVSDQQALNKLFWQFRCNMRMVRAGGYARIEY